jgi:coenzyme Q-binding protein COQ10
MQRYTKTLILPYPQEQVFDLVLDIEAYPGFVPGWRRAQVRERGANWLRVVQEMGVGPLTWRFESRADYDRSNRITIESEDNPFRQLRLDWRFEPEATGCRVALVVFIAFRSVAVGRFAGGLTPMLGEHTVEAFEKAAEQRLRRVDAGSGGPSDAA